MDAELFHELVHAPSGNAGEVAVRDDRDQRRLGALAPLEKPVREVRSLAKLRDSNVHRPDSRVEGSAPVTVALCSPVGVGFAPFRAHDSVSVRGQQRVDHGLEQISHEIRRRLREGFTEKASRVDNMRSGHRDDFLSSGM